MRRLAAGSLQGCMSSSRPPAAVHLGTSWRLAASLSNPLSIFFPWTATYINPFCLGVFYSESLCRLLQKSFNSQIDCTISPVSSGIFLLSCFEREHILNAQCALVIIFSVLIHTNDRPLCTAKTPNTASILTPTYYLPRPIHLPGKYRMQQPHCFDLLGFFTGYRLQ